MNYPQETRIQRRDGHEYIKTREYGLIKRARFVALETYGQLLRNEKVFFRDGDRTNFKTENIIPIRFSETRFKYLPKSRVVYMPSKSLTTATRG